MRKTNKAGKLKTQSSTTTIPRHPRRTHRERLDLLFVGCGVYAIVQKTMPRSEASSKPGEECRPPDIHHSSFRILP